MATFINNETGIMGQGVAMNPETGDVALQSAGPSGCMTVEDQNDYIYSFWNTQTGEVIHSAGESLSGHMTTESVSGEHFFGDGFLKSYGLTQPSERVLDPFYQNYSIVGNLNEIANKVAISASPGFTWGKSGNISSNSWLLNDSVPSNKAGRLNFLFNSEVIEMFVANELPNTFDAELWEHDGSTFNLLHTISLVNQRSISESVTGVFVTHNFELAVKVVNGSGKNVVCGILMSGQTVLGI